MFIKNFKDYIESINEGLIKTHDGLKAIENTVTELNLLGIKSQGSFKDNIISLIINDFFSIDSTQIEILFDLLSAKLTNQFGWFPSSMDILSNNGIVNKMIYNEDYILINYKNIKKIEITYESKFNTLYLNQVDKLYHLTIKEYKNKINKIGLIPKSKNKKTYHTDRIYLCSELNDCKLLIPQMKMYYSNEKINQMVILKNKQFRKNTEYIIYEVNNKDLNLKLYKDPRFKELGYYSYKLSAQK